MTARAVSKIQACAAWIVESSSRFMMHSAHVCSHCPTSGSCSSQSQMLSILKRLPSSPHLKHATGQVLARLPFLFPAPLPSPGSPADPEATPGGGTGSTSGDEDSPSDDAGGVAAAAFLRAARFALARLASFCARVLRAMAD